jgi:hypothetical protein
MVSMHYYLIKKSLCLLKKQLFLSILCLTALTHQNVAFSLGLHTEFIENFMISYLVKDFKTASSHTSLIKNLLKMDNFESWPTLKNHITHAFSPKHAQKLTSILEEPFNLSSKANELASLFKEEKRVYKVTLADLLTFQKDLKNYKNYPNKNHSFWTLFDMNKNPRRPLLIDIAHHFNQLLLSTDFMTFGWDNPKTFKHPLSPEVYDSFHEFFINLDTRERQLFVKLLMDELFRSTRLNPALKKAIKKVFIRNKMIGFDELLGLYKNFKLTYFKNSKIKGYLPDSEIYHVSNEILLKLKEIVPLTKESFSHKVDEIKTLLANKDPEDAKQIAFFLAHFITTFQFEEIPNDDFKFITESEYQLITDLLIVDLNAYYQHLSESDPEISNQFVTSLIHEMNPFIIQRSRKLNDILKNGQYPTINHYINLYFNVIGLRSHFDP